MNKRDRALYYASICVLCVAAVFIGTISYWLVWPYHVMDVNKVKILTPIVKAGDEVEVFLDATKHASYPATVLRQLINDHAWPFPVFPSNSPKGRTDWVLRLKIPENAPSGKNYAIHTTYVYKVNPIREVKVEWQTNTFEVEGKKK